MGNSEQYTILEYSTIVKPNPEYRILFSAISTINRKAFSYYKFTTTKTQSEHSLLQCNIFKLSTCFPVKHDRNLVAVKPALEKDLLEMQM